VRETHPEPLSAIVDRALRELCARGARSALVLMSDLPLVEAIDVRHVVERMQLADVVVVPDFQEEGTNALGVTPPDGLLTCFGMAESFRRHCRRAEESGLRVEIVRSRGLMFDVDGPEEWARLQARRSP
jgi:2-phospho-L-lactate guanylyltransferase